MNHHRFIAPRPRPKAVALPQLSQPQGPRALVPPRVWLAMMFVAGVVGFTLGALTSGRGC